MLNFTAFCIYDKITGNGRSSERWLNLDDLKAFVGK